MGLALRSPAPDASWALGSREVHLWYVDPEAVTDPALLAAQRELMSVAERAKQLRFFFARDRHRFLLTRALVRTVMSHYLGGDPRRWTFEENAHGRPALAARHGDSGLRFNLSHTPGMILCGVTQGHDLGVDVEDTTRPGATVEIAHHYFSPREVADLEAVPSALRVRRFFEYWTLKEAYIKARGLGLSLPLDQFSFDLRDPGFVRVVFDPRLRDRPSHWQFRTFRPTPRHQVAVGVRRADAEDLAIRVRATVPLGALRPEERW
jgi:4'-phosphopantetheinyl transferase